VVCRSGVRLTDHEPDNLYHLWRYAGHVIGVEPELNPSGEAIMCASKMLYRLTSPAPATRR
jgi:ER-bound oxygenase mpaB/B'/Rubber oxygenase, catalytic domain